MATRCSTSTPHCLKPHGYTNQSEVIDQIYEGMTRVNNEVDEGFDKLDHRMDDHFEDAWLRFCKIDASLDTLIALTRGLIGTVNDLKKRQEDLEKMARKRDTKRKAEIETAETHAMGGLLLIAKTADASARVADEVERLAKRIDAHDRRRYLHCNMPGCASAFFGDPEELASFLCARVGCQGTYVSLTRERENPTTVDAEEEEEEEEGEIRNNVKRSKSEEELWMCS
jgi:hypothetical protein